MEVIAHRGASGIEAENTISSFKKAESIGVDMIELDVRRSKDGELVIFHDRTLKRLFGKRLAISELTVAELKEISKGREIPTLEEVLANINSPVNVEIKIHGIEKQVLEKIRNFPHKVLISSFYPWVLTKIRTLDGKVPIAFLIAMKTMHLLPIANWLVKKWDFEAIHPRKFLVSAPIIYFLRLSGKKIRVWTIDTKAEYKRMKKLGVDGVITNYPHLIKEYDQDSSL